MDLSKLPRLSQTPSPGTSGASLPDQSADEPLPLNPGPAAGRPVLFCVCGAPLTDAGQCPHCGTSHGEATGDVAEEPLPSLGFEMLMSFGVGAIMLFVGSRLLNYLFVSPNSPKFPRFTFDGKPLDYLQTPHYLSDLGLVIFALAMLLDGGLLLFAKWKWAMPIAMLATLSGVLLNVFVEWRIMSMPGNYGFQINNGLAIVFGGFMLFYELSILRVVWKRS